MKNKGKAILRNPVTEVSPKIVTSQVEVENIFFDLTLIVNVDNQIIVVDNTKVDYKDFIDCSTLATKFVKIQVL
jgi:hypothetical protein